ncbi:hypothetical protein BC835DRAFT_62209 [Cytidiella melzeri]|nr:hypothetical protein BC835DRAFT_62209 [Cytidiella melzeri]
MRAARSLAPAKSMRWEYMRIVPSAFAFAFAFASASASASAFASSYSIHTCARCIRRSSRELPPKATQHTVRNFGSSRKLLVLVRHQSLTTCPSSLPRCKDPNEYSRTSKSNRKKEVFYAQLFLHISKRLLPLAKLLRRHFWRKLGMSSPSSEA